MNRAWFRRSHDRARRPATGWAWGLALLVALATACSGGSDVGPVPTIRLHPGRGDDLARASFDIHGLDAEARQAVIGAEAGAAAPPFAVVAEDAAQQEPPAPLPGTFRVVGEILRFTPRAALVPGVCYRATLDPARLPDGGRLASGPVEALFSLPPDAVAPEAEGSTRD